MSFFLRIAAGVSLAWGVGFFLCVTLAFVGAPQDPGIIGLANGLAIANIGFAYLFWRGAADPSRERTALYTALLVFGLRIAGSAYGVLYLLQGLAAVVSLLDLIASLALFVGILNALPATLRAGTEPPVDH